MSSSRTTAPPPSTASSAKSALTQALAEPGLREFVQRWAKAGPALEEQRCRDLQGLDDEAARRMSLDLFELWRPSEFDEMGAGQVEAQRIFVELARFEAQRQPER